MMLAIIGAMSVGSSFLPPEASRSALAEYVQTKMVLNHRFNVILKSVFCVNPISLVKGDNLYGAMVVASFDPSNPRILGTCTFNVKGPLKRNQQGDIVPVAAVRNLELPISPNERVFHVFMVEHDKEDKAKVVKAYLDAWKNDLTGFMRIHDGNSGEVIRDIFWSTFRRLKGERRFGRNDEEMAGWAILGHGESSFMPADEDGFDNFVNLFWLQNLAMNPARYRLNFRIERAAQRRAGGQQSDL